ncbi:MAG: putative oxidoreductase C-terminal domain-containing protein [Victivallaceae bacterium]
MHTIVIINPGHFHAGLVLRETHPQLSKDVYIYSEAGQDLDSYMRLVESFNNRSENPTDWKFHVYAAPDFMEKAVAEKKGDIAILAGKNNQKIYYIEKLHNAGFKVLSDKPLTINDDGVKVLERVLSTEPVVMDIMTERHEITSLIQKDLIKDLDVFGKFRVTEGEPTIVKESIHHLYKTVNGAPLVRPPWYFDVNVQGEGIVDVTTHLADLAQWMLFPGDSINFTKDIQLQMAKHWTTDIPLDKFHLVTKKDAFPESVADSVKDNVLKLLCNGEFIYKIKGIPVKLVVIWNLQAAPGGGDTHFSVMKGSKSDLIIEQGPETGFKPELYVKPHFCMDAMEADLKAAIASQGRKDVTVVREDDCFRIDIPAKYRTTHEEHFAEVRNDFLEMLDTGKVPADLKSNLLAKYSLLAAARGKAAS